MIIQGSFANVSGNITTDDLLKYFVENIPNIEFYKLQPLEGAFVNAAIDWKGVLHDTAAIATIASVIWGAYITFIKPEHDKDPKSSSGIYIQIKNQNNDFDQFMIGQEFKEREIFIKKFEESAKKLQLDSTTSDTKKEIEEIKKSEYWIKIK